jgi:GNAT superfamily N-acetyltransferase
MSALPTARLAVPDDVDGLVRVALAARAEIGVPAPPEAQGRVARRLRAALTDPTALVLVVESDDEVAGFAKIRPLAPTPFYDLPRLLVETIYVRPPCRRRGCGRALLRGALEHAERVGAPDVTILPLAGSRSAQRFLARLGFVQSASQRVIDTAALAERLGQRAPVSPPAADGACPVARLATDETAPRSSLSRLIALRRQQRHPSSAAA